MPNELLSAAEELLPDTKELRRRLHRSPEVGLTLPATQAIVLEALEGLDLRITTGTELSSVVAVMDGTEPGKTVLLRSDMDALPVLEETGLPFASQNEGSMHACGHDGHMAMLIGAARLLANRRRRDGLRGSVVFMFQPGEESYGGAPAMIREGVLEAAGQRPAAAFAIHLFPQIGAGGAIFARKGPIMGSSDVLRATFTGRGGHASAPHRALDPVPIAAETVLALQTYVARRIDPLDPVVVTVGMLTTGTVHNVIPETATLSGTLRTINEETRARVQRELIDLIEGLARAHGLHAKVEWDPGYPVVVNDPGMAQLALRTAADVLGADKAIEMPQPVLAAEDFAYVLQEVPGAMLFLGAGPAGVEEPAALHSNRMIFDEEALAAGIAVHAALALRTLNGAAAPPAG
jgi:hippurate hydrolase